ncbi:PREDICTED: solute carrier family 22 member 16 [Chrysochloris asiatica]|uniref:Solute carrier family 22 member 16 n=1 Tax=Chrysochloris asiatica TaxID=185453 RepID=A0A9B0T7P1_CHRAS|nr:PREDICTED: solute carrier family 22 member 16 [Chrysochloris asiatica]
MATPGSTEGNAVWSCATFVILMHSLMVTCSPLFCRFQIFLYFICAFQNISCGIHYLASVFMAATPQYACRPPGNVSRVLFHNASTSRLEDIWALMLPGQEGHIAVQLQDGVVWELTGCRRSWRQDTLHLEYEYSGRKHDFPCSDGYIYDQSKWESTVVTQWDLVCHREWLTKLIQPVFMFGVLLGAVIFGCLSDRIGRRLILWSTSIGKFLFGIAVAFTFDYYSFMAARFLLAMAASGYLVVVFVYVTEFIGMKSRTWASIHVHSFFAIGIMAVALTGYFVRTWWLYQIVLSILTLPFVLCCWLLPETPFWLLSETRYDEAQKVVDVMAKWNRTSSCKLSELLSLHLNDPVGSNPSEVKKHSVLDLFCDWNIAIRTLIVWLIWFTGSLGFYSFSLNSVNLGGNAYLNLFLMGICSILIIFFQGYHIWSIVAAMAGKFAIGAAFGLIYLYTAELYPTIVRSMAVGSGSMMCRVGSIVAPFCVYLTDVWIFMPQLLVGIVAFLSGILTLHLPETLGKPLVTTWEEVARQRTGKDSSSGRLLPTTESVVLDKIEVVNTGNSVLCE